VVCIGQGSLLGKAQVVDAPPDVCEVLSLIDLLLKLGAVFSAHLLKAF